MWQGDTGRLPVFSRVITGCLLRTVKRQSGAMKTGRVINSGPCGGGLRASRVCGKVHLRTLTAAYAMGVT